MMEMFMKGYKSYSAHCSYASSYGGFGWESQLMDFGFGCEWNVNDRIYWFLLFFVLCWTNFRALFLLFQHVRIVFFFLLLSFIALFCVLFCRFCRINATQTHSIIRTVTNDIRWVCWCKWFVFAKRSMDKCWSNSWVGLSRSFSWLTSKCVKSEFVVNGCWNTNVAASKCLCGCEVVPCQVVVLNPVCCVVKMM